MRNTKIAAVALLAAAAGGCMRPYNEPEFVDVARIRWTNFARLAGIDAGSGALVATEAADG